MTRVVGECCGFCSRGCEMYSMVQMRQIPPSYSETANGNGMNFEPQIEGLKSPPFTKFGVKLMIGLVTVHVLRFCSYLAAAVESADQF